LNNILERYIVTIILIDEKNQLEYFCLITFIIPGHFLVGLAKGRLGHYQVIFLQG
jgi:hypothetical protein